MHLTRWLVGIAALFQAVDTAISLSVIADKMRQPFFSWLPVPGGMLPLYVGLWCVAAVAFASGWRTRLSGPVLAVLMIYALLVDQQTYSNHLYLMVIVTLVLSWLPPALTRPWLRWQMTAVYAFGALSKLNPIGISGALIATNLRAGLLPVPESLLRWEIIVPLGLLSIAIDAFLAVAFWSPRYRRAGLIAGLGFHALILLVFPPAMALQLIAFGLTMYALYAATLAPELRPTDILHRIGRTIPRRSQPAGQPTT